VESLHNVIDWIVSTVSAWGYGGIFVAMFLESSFFPFPSEVIMIPAGYLAYKGEMNIIYAILSGIIGSIAGALFNYYLALFFGRKVLLRYGKYIFLNRDKLDKLEAFFNSHGEISTFNGRLIPGVRQYISLPAGLAKMDIKLFGIYTALGAGIWVTVLTILGYFLGANESLIKEYLHTITLFVLIIVSAITYIYYKRVQNRRVSD